MCSYSNLNVHYDDTIPITLIPQILHIAGEMIDLPERNACRDGFEIRYGIKPMVWLRNKSEEFSHERN